MQALKNFIMLSARDIIDKVRIPHVDTKHRIDPSLAAWTTGIPVYGDEGVVSYIEYTDLDKIQFKSRPSGRARFGNHLI